MQVPGEAYIPGPFPGGSLSLSGVYTIPYIGCVQVPGEAYIPGPFTGGSLSLSGVYTVRSPRQGEIFCTEYNQNNIKYLEVFEWSAVFDLYWIVSAQIGERL